MKIKNIKELLGGKIAIHCPEEWMATELIKKAEIQGIHWGEQGQSLV